MKKKKMQDQIYSIGSDVCRAAVVNCLHAFRRFSTGEAANVDELQEYALPVETLSIPEEKKIIALGEATHGNVEFQRLKLEVFKNCSKSATPGRLRLRATAADAKRSIGISTAGRELRRRLRLRSALPFIERRRWQNSSPICVNTTKTLRRGRMFAFTALICSEFPARFNF